MAELFPTTSPSDALAFEDGPEAHPVGADAPYPPSEGLPCHDCGEFVPNGLDDCPACLTSAGAGVTVTMPLKLVPGMNVREHWRTRKRRVEREHDMVTCALEATGATAPPLPVTLVIVRTGWCELDPDNCAGACKGVVDSACAWLRVDDRNPGIHVHLAQRVTRERRAERYGRGGHYTRVVAASTVTLTIRPWRPEDGTDRLRVLARGSEAI
jgi:hypothetical protein